MRSLTIQTFKIVKLSQTSICPSTTHSIRPLVELHNNLLRRRLRTTALNALLLKNRSLRYLSQPKLTTLKVRSWSAMGSSQLMSKNLRNSWLRGWFSLRTMNRRLRQSARHSKKWLKEIGPSEVCSWKLRTHIKNSCRISSKKSHVSLKT